MCVLFIAKQMGGKDPFVLQIETSINNDWKGSPIAAHDNMHCSSQNMNYVCFRVTSSSSTFAPIIQSVKLPKV